MSLAGLLFGIAIVNGHGQTAGSLANGLSAGAVSRGGTMAAESGDVLDAVEGNPAGLAGLRERTVDVTGVGVFAWGSFRNTVDPDGTMSGVAGALPYGAVGVPLGKRPGQTRWSAALAATPDELMRANWRYLDPPGTAGASYGLTGNQSQIIGIRTSAALAWTMGSKWAAGATVGLVVNSNTLKAPYIFQQQPQLAGLKVLLDLNTRGVGWNG
jgi:long-subunit fatty acid transport protein